jgi:hypothetical protein
VKITSQLNAKVNLMTKSNWKGKEGTYRTSNMIVSEINLIFPLPFTREHFPLTNKTKVGEANCLRLKILLNLLGIWFVAPESTIQRSCKLSSSDAVIKAVRLPWLAFGSTLARKSVRWLKSVFLIGFALV